jgi:hypothetical protein
MADHNTPVRHNVDPGMIPAEIPQGAVSIGESHLHESSSVELRPIITTTVTILAVMFISMGLMAGLYKFWIAGVKADSRVITPLQEIPPDFKEPKLQTDEPSGLAAHIDTSTDAVEGYKVTEPGHAAIPVDEAMRRVAATGSLPTGTDWTLRPDERMVGGVIMNAEQVRYANTPPSQAYVESPGGGAPTGAPPAAGAAAAGAAPAGAPAAQPQTTTTRPAAKAAAPGNQ